MEKSLITDELLSIVFDCLKVNYFVVDTEGKILACNQNMQAIIGDTTRGDIDAKAWENSKAVMASRQRSVIEEEYQGKHYLSIKSPIICNDEVTGLIGIAIDITQQKQAERAKRSFLRNMSHDVRTPLSGIYSIARMLYDEEKDGNKKDFLGDVVKSSERLTELLTQILEVSALDEKHPVKPEILNIKESITEVAELFIPSIKSKNLSLSIECPDQVVTTDRFRLNKILIDLLSNAVKFTEKGGIKIQVNLKPALEVVISDTGIGIPAEKLNIIFDKFTKLKDSGESHEFGGSGVGLHIVRQFADEIGANINVTSESGKGSIFTLKFREN